MNAHVLLERLDVAAMALERIGADEAEALLTDTEIRAIEHAIDMTTAAYQRIYDVVHPRTDEP